MSYEITATFLRDEWVNHTLFKTFIGWQRFWTFSNQQHCLNCLTRSHKFFSLHSFQTPEFSFTTQSLLGLQHATMFNINSVQSHTVWCHYNAVNFLLNSHDNAVNLLPNSHGNAVNFLPNSHDRHPIARPWGQGMGCLLWVWSLVYVLLVSSQRHMYYCDKLNRVITALNMQGLSYLGLTRSISWLLMPWLLTSPGHQQPWYWLYREYVGPSLTWGRILSTCVISMWLNDTKCKYMFMFPQKNLACKGLTLLVMKVEYSINTKTANALALCTTRSSATTVFTTKDKHVLVFHEKGFQPPVPSQGWKMIENMNTFLGFLN